MAAMIAATNRLADAIGSVTGAAGRMAAGVTAASAAARASMGGTGFGQLASNIDQVRLYSYQAALALEDIYQVLRDGSGTAAAAGTAMGNMAAGTAAAGMALGRWAPGWLTFGSALTIAHVALAVFGAQVAADTIGIAAFGAEAYRAVGPAVSAASSVASLTTAYAALDPYQKAAALSIKSFTDNLQIAGEAGIFGVFYQGLALVNQAMGHAGGIVTQATQAFSDFFGMLKADLGSASWARLLGGQVGLIRTDLDALFGLINSGINLIPALFHNFNFLGVAVLNAASAFLRGVSAVAEWNPALTRAIALAGVAYGAYRILWAGLGAGPGPLARLVTWVGALGTRVATASTYMSEGAGVAASYALGISGITTAGLIAAGAVAAFAAGLIAVGIAVHNALTPMQQITGGLIAQYNATGNNVAGYQALAGALGQVTRSTADYSAAAAGLRGAGSALVLSQSELAGVLNAAQQAIGNISTNASHFGSVLHLTKSQVIAFANATGIDLSHALSMSGTQFIIDAAKIRGYATAVALSHHPLSQFMADAQQASNAANSLADQVTALTAAYNALVTPTLNVIQGAVTLRQDQASLAAALKASNDHVGLQTQAAQNAAQAMVRYAKDTIAQSQNIKQQTGSTQAAIAPLQAFAAWLAATGAHGAYVSQVLRLIKQAEDALYNKKFTITTYFLNIGQPGGTPVGTPGGGHVRGPGSGGALATGAAVFTGVVPGGAVVHNHYVTVNVAGTVLAEHDLARTVVTALNRQTGRNVSNQLVMPGRLH